MEIEFRRVILKKEIPWDILLLADPSLKMIKSYINKSIVYSLIVKKKFIGCVVLFSLNNQRVEIKALAIKEKYQGRGYGAKLLEFSFEEAKRLKYKEVFIGTANSSIGQLYLYQKMGFEINSLRKNFFIKNYKHPIWENQIQAKHLVWLKRKV